jgi:hypothetical protein
MKKKRRMPPHIVLPNGMWRFVKAGSKKTIKSRTKRRFLTMARRRYSRRSSSGGFGMRGLGGISLKGILAGAGASTIGSNLGITNAIPYGDYVAGAAAGHFAKTGVLSGVIGAALRNMLKGNVLGTNTVSIQNY